ncbi:hypothetical protein GCM10027577_24430 [Spirosoma fluminis]
MYRWISLGKSRNLTSHTYNEETANEIAEAVRDEYVNLLNDVAARLDTERQGPRSSLFDTD